VPDDDRLDGTRDPHEYGRRHRREEAPPPPEPQQPRRRRRSVESGGVSVADLVQRHTGSRPDLTPVNPEQLRQNGVATPGRRARPDEPQGRPAPAPRPIASPLDGGAGFPPDRTSPPRPPQPQESFPRDEAAVRRPGGNSSFFTIPSDAVRDSFSSEPGEPPPDDNGFPTDFPVDDGPSYRPRNVGEGSGPRNGLPPDAGAPRRKSTRRPRPAAGPATSFDGFGSDAPNGFPPDPEAGRHNGMRRAGEASAHYPVPGADPRRAGETSGPRRRGMQEAFGPESRRNAARRAGEASAHYPVPGTDAAPGFPPDPEPSRRNGRRRAGETSAPRMMPGTDAPNGFPPDPEAPRHNGMHRAGEAQHDASNGFPPDPEAPRRNGGRRGGEASAPRIIPAPDPNGFPPDGFGPDPEASRRNGGRRGEAPAHHGIPGADAQNGFDGFATDPERSRRNGARRAGDPAGHRGLPEAPNGFPPDDGRNGMRRAGEASSHLPIPGGDVPNGFPPDGAAPRRKGGRRADGFPQDGFEAEPPRGRRGESSGPFPGPSFPPDPEAPRPSPRRVGEASTHFGAPGREAPLNGRPGDGGFPPEPGQSSGPRDALGRPEGAARRRAARAATMQSGLDQRSGPFPADSPPQPGQGSGLFPVDDFRRPGDELSEPRGTSAADAPDPRPRRAAGVPPVPPPPPPMGDDDLVTMTTEMEAIDGGNEELQKRRTIDHTLARFSAVHDEIKAEEREKKAKRRKLRPWERDDEMDRLDELEAQQSMAVAIPNLEPKEEEDEQQAKKKRRWRKGKNAGKAFSVFVAGLIFLSTAVAWGFKSYIENSSQQVDALDPDSDSIKDAAAQLGDENFLLVGSDTRAGATAEDGVGSEDSVQGARSDTVMIAHVPKNRERVVVVSFPRDLEVSRPACEGWDPKTGNYTGQQHPEEKRVKLNTAYMVGGPKCVTKLVQNISGLAINHFVGIDFHGFKDMVDAVQGVEVCVERPMKDKELGLVVPEAGKNVKLTGDQALNFVRARKVEGDPTADYGRIIRQQRFLSSLLRKAMSTEVLLNPSKLTNFVKAFAKATFGDNIGVDQLFTLGESMQGVGAGRVTFITLPTTGYENERHNEDLRTDDADALFEAVRQDVPLPGEAPKKADAPAKNKKQSQTQVQSGLMQQKQQQPAGGPVDPSTVKIQVLNGGNGTAGVAGDTGDDLAEFGFQVVRVGATDPTDRTVIRYSKSRAAQAQTLKAAVPGATLVEDPSAGGAILLVLGPDFDGKVQSPTTGGSPADVPENLSTVNASDVSCA
jgi:LCP family protein required for cell wall assembly